MRKVSLDGNDYVVNLNWHHIIVDEGVDQEIKRTVQQYGLSYGVVQTKGDVTAIGLTNQSFVNNYSAAAYLAECEPNILLVEKISDLMFWVVAVHDGLVMPMTDVIVSGESLSRTLGRIYKTILDFEADEGIHFRRCSLLDIDNVDFEYIGFTDIVKRLGAPKTKHRVEKLYSDVGKKKKVLLAVVAIALSYFLYDTFFSSDDTIDPKLVSKVIPQKEKVDPAVVRKQYIDSLLRDVNNVLSWFSPDERFNKLEALLLNFNIYYKGWQMTEVNMNGTDAAAIKYKNKSDGRIKQINAEVGKYKSFTLAPDGSVVSYMVPVGSLPAVSKNFKSFDEFKNYKWIDLANSFQELYGIKWTINPNSSSVGIVLPTLAQYPVQPTPFKTYRWEVSTNEIYRIHEIKDTLKKFSNLAVESIDINVVSRSLKITGVLYAFN